ncbi:MAG: chlorophyll synthesis pathway protein BchC [Sandaracinaceae bacterium]
MLNAFAVVFEAPGQLSLRALPLHPGDPGEVEVDVLWTGISTGTERLLYTGQMPPFPGMGYPLVPGYETVGRVVDSSPETDLVAGDLVFVPGASCFGEVRGLFGGAASRLRVPAARVTRIEESLGAEGVLLALAATAQHALAGGDEPPDLIVGHGVLGRLLARLSVAHGGTPVVWEKNPGRVTGAAGYEVVDPEADGRRDYRSIVDVSGDPTLLDTLIGRLGKGGEVVLAGFYAERLSFAFPLAFMKEARLRVAAEWANEDLHEVLAMLSGGRLDLGELITHRMAFDHASEAYATAFTDPSCLKMVLDWRDCS